MSNTRDVSFDLTMMHARLGALGLEDPDVIKEIGIGPKTLDNWWKSGRGYRTHVTKLVQLINQRAEKSGQLNLRLPDTFMKPINRLSAEELDADDDVPHPDLIAAMRLLCDARKTEDGKKRASFLREAVVLADKAYIASGDEFSNVIASQALRMLGAQANSIGERATYYRDAVSRVSISGTAYAAIEFAQATIDMAMDPLSGVTAGVSMQTINAAESALRRVLKENAPDLSNNVQADLLARLSAIIRARLRTQKPAPSLEQKRLREAEDCAAKAVAFSPKANARLEQAMVILAQARLVQDDAIYTRQLRLVNDILRDINEKFFFEPGLLAAVHFHRYNYAPLLVCRLFERLQRHTDDVTRLYANAALYAESALSLSYDGYAPSEVNRHLQNAARVSFEAIQGGFRTARNLVNHARLLARRNEGVAAQGLLLSALPKLMENEPSDVAAAVREAVHQAKNDPLSEAFAIGIADAGVLCALGTALAEINSDENISKRLYDLAYEMNNGSAIVNSNLARWYLGSPLPGSERQCRYHLRMAKETAPRRYRWWKWLRFSLDSKSLPRPPRTKETSSQLIQKIRLCKEIEQLGILLTGPGRLLSIEPGVLVEALNRLAELRYCVDTTRWNSLKEASAYRAYQMRIYDRTVVVVGADAGGMRSKTIKLLEESIGDQQATLVLFDMGAATLAARSALSSKVRTTSQQFRRVRITEDDMLGLLNERTTIDRCLYSKIDDAGVFGGLRP